MNSFPNSIPQNSGHRWQTNSTTARTYDPGWGLVGSGAPSLDKAWGLVANGPTLDKGFDPSYRPGEESLTLSPAARQALGM